MATPRDYPKEVDAAVKKLTAVVRDMTTQMEEQARLAATAQSRIDELMREIQLKDSKAERLERTMKEVQEKAQGATDLATKNRALQGELDAIKGQLEKMSQTYRELMAQQKEAIPVQELLAIYIHLLEDVFGAQPHAKALFLLHGAKTQMTRTEITKTAGHEPTAIRKALGDLSRAGLVDYDVEKETVRLKKRLYA